MTRTKKQGFVLAAFAAATLATGAPAATGAEIKTKVKISKLSASGASGTVSSKESKCEKGRKVTLFYDAEYSQNRIGKTKTDKRGDWKIKDQITERGVFYVKVAAKGKCASAASKDERLR